MKKINRIFTSRTQLLHSIDVLNQSQAPSQLGCVVGKLTIGFGAS